jgi:transcriptional antiterminator NusG
MEKNWYVVHTYSGYENKVKTNLEKRLDSMGMQDRIFRVMVPMEEEIEHKDGKKKTVMRKVFPGYVLVEMIMTDDSWYVVRNTPGVTGFVGSAGAGSKPTPLLPDEVQTILKQMGVEEVQTTADFALGESVKVVKGPLENLVGVIEGVDVDREILKVLVDMFGRETPVELDFEQVEKL